MGKKLIWMGSSKKDLKRFPEEVKRNVGYALHFAQEGVTHPSCKLLKGYGSGVYEIIEDYNTDTYRAVYLVRFEKIIYVIHAFQKKSKEGIKTPQR